MGRCEAGARVEHLHPHAPWREPELDAQILLGSDFGVADCVVHQLGYEQEDVPADGGGQHAVAREHRLACRRGGFAPPVEYEGKACPRAGGVRAGGV
jgi:hypothetical protein